MTTSAQDNRFAPFLAFHDNANFVLKTGLFIAILWPLAAMATAIFLSPSNAQTIVPIIELSPLAGLFFIILGASFGIAILFRNPLVRQGFVWVCALIGVELAIGVYFALVPVSNDPGLIPLLVLAASALFFLRIAGYAQWLSALLTLLLIGITVTFFVGGRAELLKQFHSIVTQTEAVHTTTQVVPAPPANPTSSNPPLIPPWTAPSPAPSPAVPAAVRDAAPLVTSPAPDLAPSEPSDTPALAPIEPSWYNPQHVAMDDYAFDVPPCIIRGANLHCFFRVTNQGADEYLHLTLSLGAYFARLIDERGNEYRADTVQLGTTTGTYATKVMPCRVPMLGSVTFSKIPPTTPLAVLVEIPAMHGQNSYNLGAVHVIQFHNIQIQRKIDE